MNTAAASQQPKLYTQKEFAHVHGVDPRTVRRWVKLGKVKVIKIGLGQRIVDVPICPISVNDSYVNWYYSI